MLVAYTENFQWLFDSLKESLGSEKTIELVPKVSKFTQEYNEFRFRSDAWFEGVEAQMTQSFKFLTNEIEDGEYCILSDVDIIFLQPSKIIEIVDLARKTDKEFLAVKEEKNDDINSGFIIVKKTKAILDMYEHVNTQMQLGRVTHADQEEINNYLNNNDVNFGFIPRELAGMGKRYKLSKSWVLFHAINAKTLEQKKVMITDVKKRYKENYV